jgi:hypothetical protein
MKLFSGILDIFTRYLLIQVINDWTLDTIMIVDHCSGNDGNKCMLF